MTKLTEDQITAIRTHIADNPEHSAQDVANYFDRVSDLDYGTTLAITSAATHIINGQEQYLDGLIDHAGDERQG